MFGSIKENKSADSFFFLYIFEKQDGSGCPAFLCAGIANASHFCYNDGYQSLIKDIVRLTGFLRLESGAINDINRAVRLAAETGESGMKRGVGMKVAKIALNLTARNLDRLFDYAVPEGAEILPGMKVVVPFGASNKKTQGIVAELADSSEWDALKQIISFEPDCCPPQMIPLAFWLRERYFCTWYDALRLMTQPGVNFRFCTYVKLLEQDPGILKEKTKHSAVQSKIIEQLLVNQRDTPLSDLADYAGKNINASIKALKKAGVIALYEKEYRTVSDKKVRCVQLTDHYSDFIPDVEEYRTKYPKRWRAVAFLRDNDCVPVQDLILFADVSLGIINTLVKHGIAEFSERILERIEEREIQPVPPFDLTDEQQAVVDDILKDIEAGKGKTTLLQGVTGSGKTEVYLHLIDAVLKKGKQAIVLVPEISLTPQMIERFCGRFGGEVAVLHSGLPLTSRFEYWKKLRKGEMKVVVGARSAIFAPLDNIGIIIIDEEHESAYKSESAPCYDAREIALFRMKNENAVLLLSSATPSVLSYKRAMDGKYRLVKMTKRYNEVALPDVEIVDMRREFEKGNRSIFSERLFTLLKETIENQKQAILFLNRRGYSSFVSCRKCGHVFYCKNCSLPLKYHVRENKIICHLCGYQEDNPKSCPECGSPYVRYFGTGTQKVEEELRSYFPDAKILRMDMDTTAGKNSHEKILQKFGKEGYDILLGTQMVTKGLDFPNVSLVGVLSADMSLNQDSCYAFERTFSQLTQVCGRAGRGDTAGKAVLQTYMPGHFVLELAKRQDYEEFYKNEILIRKRLLYPPFCDIIMLVFSSEQEHLAMKAATEIKKYLLEHTSRNDGAYAVLGPTPCPLLRANHYFRWQLCLKCRVNEPVKMVINKVKQRMIDNGNQVFFNIYVNPESIL